MEYMYGVMKDLDTYVQLTVRCSSTHVRGVFLGLGDNGRASIGLGFFWFGRQANE